MEISMKTRSYLSCCILFVALSALMANPALAKPWYESYAEAEKAIKAERWSEAIERINLALESKGDSSSRARTYGMNFTEYFPYFKLGIAYYHLGLLDAALQAFDTEQKLGAIQQSELQHSELRRFQALIQNAKTEADDDEQERVQEIVEKNMTAAEELEQQGQFDAAMVVLGNVLAVAPDDTKAKGFMERLRTKMSQHQAERELDQKVEGMIAEGKSLLTSNQYQEAVSFFDRALSLKSSDEAHTLRAEALMLRDQTRARLRAQIQAAEDADRLSSLIATSLRDARSLEISGDFLEALTRLQSVLALDPSNEEALPLQVRLSQALAEADMEQTRLARLQTLQVEVQTQFDAKDYEKALSTANHILALDPANEVARGLISRAYREINRKLLGTDRRENFPPAIRFADFREFQLDDGLQVERVSDSRFRLTGTIFDDAPVDLAFELVFSESHDESARTSTPSRPIEGKNQSQQLDNNTISLFNVSHQLEPGLSIFRIIVADHEGLTSSSEYAVLYVTPLYRSRWFYFTLTVILLVIAGTLYGGRIHRRNRLRVRQFNPYIAGAPVLDEGLFFGRDDLIDRILPTIHNNSLLLFGERRIGKTSLQHHLKKRLSELRDPDYDFYPAYIDLQGTPQEKFFATVAYDVFEELAPHLEGLQPGTSLTDGQTYSYRDLVRDLREIIKVLKKKSNKRIKLVLLIDEVDELNTYDPKINQKLRSLFMKSFADSLVAVVSGVGIRKQWDSESSPWYNFFEEIEVKPLTRQEAEKLIIRPISGMFRLEAGVVDRIINLTDCKPYLIQKLCIALVTSLHKEKCRTIKVAHVDSIGRPEEA